MEHATATHPSARSLAEIPQFQQHLKRTGLTMAQWEARNKSAQPDMTSEMMSLQARRVRLNARR